eukprot:UN0831
MRNPSARHNCASKVSTNTPTFSPCIRRWCKLHCCMVPEQLLLCGQRREVKK